MAHCKQDLLAALRVRVRMTGRRQGSPAVVIRFLRKISSLFRTRRIESGYIRENTVAA